jgi:hypothetical protein
MNPLSLAWVFVTGMIAVLYSLGKWNRKQGWTKRRGHWLEVQATAAMKAFAARNQSLATNDAHLAHIDDLGRLNQSLVAHSDSRRPAAVPEKDLAKSR